MKPGIGTLTEVASVIGIRLSLVLPISTETVVFGSCYSKTLDGSLINKMEQSHSASSSAGTSTEEKLVARPRAYAHHQEIVTAGLELAQNGSCGAHDAAHRAFHLDPIRIARAGRSRG